MTVSRWKLPTADVIAGDLLLIRPGQDPVDGTGGGTSEVDESVVTGESLPVSNRPVTR